MYMPFLAPLDLQGSPGKAKEAFETALQQKIEERRLSGTRTSAAAASCETVKQAGRPDEAQASIAY